MNDSAEQIIADAINRVYRETGRKIDRISVSWVDMTQIDSTLAVDLRVSHVEIESRTEVDWATR